MKAKGIKGSVVCERVCVSARVCVYVCVSVCGRACVYITQPKEGPNSYTTYTATDRS